MLFSGRLVIGVCAASLLLPALLCARDVTQPDYTERSPFGGGDGGMILPDQRRIEVNRNISDRRFPVTEWHGHFSNIGRQQARIDTTPREHDVLTHRNLSFDVMDTTLSRHDGRHAYLRNYSNVDRAADAPEIDGVVRRFDGPVGGARSELDQRDEISMDELNRFFYMRNRRDASDSGEIPVRQAGSGE